MGEALKANFEAYVAQIKNEGEEGPQEEKEEEEAKLDLDLYKDLKTKNGRSGEQIFSMLLNKVFDEDTSKVE